MKTIYIGLLILFIVPFHSFGKELDIFIIRRSKNKNEVHYQMHVDNNCQVVDNEPVAGIWKLLEEGPNKTKSLSMLDHLAYGAENQEIFGNWVYFNLKALGSKLIRSTAIFDSEGNMCWPIVQVKINGEWALLDYIFVSSKEGLLMPKVMYIDIFGKSLDSIPKQVTERIEPRNNDK
jgi:Domain of unknown function (DUF4833)